MEKGPTPKKPLVRVIWLLMLAAPVIGCGPGDTVEIPKEKLEPPSRSELMDVSGQAAAPNDLPSR